MPHTPSFRRKSDYHKSKRFVVKIQASLHTTAATRQILVYNQDKSIKYEEDVNEDTLAILAGRPKAYFWARVNGTVLDIEEEAPDPGW